MKNKPKPKIKTRRSSNTEDNYEMRTSSVETTPGLPTTKVEMVKQWPPKLAEGVRRNSRTRKSSSPIKIKPLYIHYAPNFPTKATEESSKGTEEISCDDLEQVKVVKKLK